MSIEQALPNATAHPVSRPGSARSNPALTRQRRGIHVLVADEKGIIRDALCALLGAMPEIGHVSSVATGSEVLRIAASIRPDVVTIEFPRPLEEGATLIAALKRQRSKTRVIVLTYHLEKHLIEAALRAGADGYLLKKDSRAELADALNSVLAGKKYLSPAVSGRVIRGGWHGAEAVDKRKRAEHEITYRERQVIRLVARGHPTREIAQMLSLSPKTVEKHRASVMRKFGLRNASAVAAFATAHGFADD